MTINRPETSNHTATSSPWRAYSCGRLSRGLIKPGVLQGALLDGGARRLLAKEVLVFSLGLVPVDRQLDGDVQLALVERFEQISERLGHPCPAQRRLVGERGQVDHWQRELGTHH